MDSPARMNYELVIRPLPGSSIELRVSAMHDLLMLASHNIQDARKFLARVIMEMTHEDFTFLMVPLYQWINNVLSDSEPDDHNSDMPVSTLKESTDFMRELFFHNEATSVRFLKFLVDDRNPYGIRMVALNTIAFFMTNLFDTPEDSVRRTVAWYTLHVPVEQLKTTFIDSILEAVLRHAIVPTKLVGVSESLLLLSALISTTEAGVFDSSVDLCIDVLKNVDHVEERATTLNGCCVFYNMVVGRVLDFDKHIRPFWPKIVPVISKVLLRSVQNISTMSRTAECIVRYLLRVFYLYKDQVANDVVKMLTLAHPWFFVLGSHEMKEDLRMDVLTLLTRTDSKKTASAPAALRTWARAIRDKITSFWMPKFLKVPSWVWTLLSAVHEVNHAAIKDYIDEDIVRCCMDEITETLFLGCDSEPEAFTMFQNLVARVPVLSMYVYEDDEEHSRTKLLVDELHVLKVLRERVPMCTDIVLRYPSCNYMYNVLFVTLAGLRLFLLQRSGAETRQQIWSDMVGAWSTEPYESEQQIVTLIMNRIREKPVEAWDDSTELPVLTALMAVMGASEDIDLDVLSPFETDIITKCSSENIVRSTLLYLCQTMAQRKRLKDHPLLRYPFWELGFPKCRPTLAHWQTISVLYVINKRCEDDSTDDDSSSTTSNTSTSTTSTTSTGLSDMLCGLGTDLGSIQLVYERNCVTRDDQVYVLQYAALLYRLEVLEEDDTITLKSWFDSTLKECLKQGSFEALMLLKCVLSWGLKFRTAAAEFITAIRENFTAIREHFSSTSTSPLKNRDIQEEVRSILETLCAQMG